MLTSPTMCLVFGAHPAAGGGRGTPESSTAHDSAEVFTTALSSDTSGSGRPHQSGVTCEAPNLAIIDELFTERTLLLIKQGRLRAACFTCFLNHVRTCCLWEKVRKIPSKASFSDSS